MSALASVSAAEVHQYAASLIQRYLKLRDFGHRCTSSVMITVLLYAASRVVSISNACARLAKAPSDETFRQALLATLPPWKQLQRRINRGLAADLPQALLKRSQRIAIDIREIPYHGEPLRDSHEIRRGQSRSGTTRFHDYATAYVVRQGYRFTLAMVWMRQGDSLIDVLRTLLRQVRQAGVQVRLVLLDRGFFSSEVVRYLQAARTPFLTPLRASGRRPRDKRQAQRGAARFFEQKRSGWARHTWRGGKGQGLRATVNVCVCCRNDAGRQGRHGRHTLAYAYWGFHPGSIAWVRQTYRRRFGIETSYRQMERARIRTSTRDPLRRLLFAGLALLLRNAWVWLHLMRLASRHGSVITLHLERLRFTDLLLKLQTFAEHLLNPDPCNTSQLPTPHPLVTNPT
jgi:DDE family transposase